MNALLRPDGTFIATCFSRPSSRCRYCFGESNDRRTPRRRPAQCFVDERRTWFNLEDIHNKSSELAEASDSAIQLWHATVLSCELPFSIWDEGHPSGFGRFLPRIEDGQGHPLIHRLPVTVP